MPAEKHVKNKADEAWEKKLQGNYERNKAYAKPDQYTTALNPQSEIQFRAWLAANKVPFNANSAINDYDMRGFWLALQSKDPAAVSAVNPYDKRIHYPDRWKTPYHETFSSESQWAKPGAPSWNKQDQLLMPSGQVVFDSRAAAVSPEQRAAPAPVPQETSTDAAR